MLVLALENQRQGWLHHVCVSTGWRETKVKFTCFGESQIPELSSWKPIWDGSRDLQRCMVEEGVGFLITCGHGVGL